MKVQDIYKIANILCLGLEARLEELDNERYFEILKKLKIKVL